MDLHGKTRELMDACGWTIYRLSKESGVSWSTIRNMFSRNTEPTVPMLEALCDGLGISLATLLLGEGCEELDESQRELLGNWNLLNDHNKAMVIELMKTLNSNEVTASRVEMLAGCLFFHTIYNIKTMAIQYQSTSMVRCIRLCWLASG